MDHNLHHEHTEPMTYFKCDSPLTTAAVAFGHSVSVGTTPGAEGADWEGCCMILQVEEAGPLKEWRNQRVCLPCA